MTTTMTNTTNKRTLVCLALLAAFSGAAQAHGDEACDSSATLISQIQGGGKSSPMVGQQVTVRALVSAVKPGMGGYYLQEEKSDWDNNSKTSEGIFVAYTAVKDQSKIQAGDLVTLTAEVEESHDFTQLSKPSQFKVCSHDNKVDAITVKLPLSDKYQMETVEGMLIKLPQNLTLSDTYNLALYGQMILSNGRMFSPTNVASPGKAANKVAAANRLNQIIIDDSSTEKNPTLPIDTNHTFRTGNHISGVEGVVHYSFGNYLIETTGKMVFIADNKRLAEPPIKTKGQLRVASFNVLNYFNGKGPKKEFPTKRGANTLAEFERQTIKIVAAMKAIRADIFGLMELENDGYDKNSAIVELTDNLNVATGANYQIVRPKSDKLGDGMIAVGMIYDAAKVEPVGTAATLSEFPFNFKSRQPLAQSFKDKKSGETFTVAVNHFKSKGSCPKDKTDPNARKNDGQACWNALRVESSQKLAKWLKSNPTGNNDKDILIIGDLNANAKEDPITALISAGYQNMLAKYQGEDAYSFVYRGQAGYLDHALASASMAGQIVDATDWHINADEMRLTDYNLENKSETDQKRLFKGDAFRSSDHDPLIVELSLK
jgi:predicted extracellular nuclease